MKRADGIQNLQTAYIAVTEALSTFHSVTEENVPGASDVIVKTSGGRVIIKKDGTVIFDLNEGRLTRDEYVKGITSWLVPAEDVCPCCKGTGHS